MFSSIKTNLLTMKNYVLIVLGLFLFSNLTLAQDTDATIVKGAPNVFIKCWQCDMTRMKRKIDFVNYVRQRQDADVVVIVTNQSTGAGEKVSIYFEGQRDYSSLQDTLSLDIKDTETESIIDDKIISKVKQGLLPYFLNSPLAEKITYEVGVEKEKAVEKIVDPWNSWVFNASLRGSFNGSSSSDRLSVYGNINANRITKKDKWRFSVSSNFNVRHYYFRDSNNVVIDSSTITSSRESKYFSGSYIYSLDDHWSIGGFTNVFSNTYSNYNIGSGLKLGLEYNVFNFEESDRKSLIFSYKIGTNYNDYVDTTVFFKKAELLFSHSIGVDLYQKQKWGNVSLGASFFSYLHDIRINNLSFNTNVDWNIFKGLTLSIGAYVSFVNDQISLPKQETDVIGTVLGDRILSTDYSAYTYVGLRYTFGSKYANAVNPRFSGGSRTYYFF